MQFGEKECTDLSGRTGRGHQQQQQPDVLATKLVSHLLTVTRHQSETSNKVSK